MTTRSISRYPSGEPAVLHGVLLRSKVTAATPRFVAHSPVTNVERIFEPGSSPFVGQRGGARGGVAVLNPAIELLGWQAAQICSQVRLPADQLAKLHELISAEAIGIIAMSDGSRRRVSEGPKVSPPWTLVHRADAIPPVIAVGETAAREAHDRRFDLPHLVDQFFANAIHVRDFRVLAYPDSVINHSAQILGEMAVDIRGNWAERLIEKNINSRVGVRLRPGNGRRLASQSKSSSGGSAAEEFSAFDHGTALLANIPHDGKRLP